MKEDDIVGGHHQMDLSLSKFWEMVKGWGSLACCCPWGGKELDTTE